MKVVAIVQARMDSSRLPGKVMKRINGVPLIEIIIRRLGRSKFINQCVVATSESPSNQKLISHLDEICSERFIGSEDDVLKRYFEAAKHFSANTIVRITGDCPLIDPDIIDEVIESFFSSKSEYASNREPPTFPDGLDVEVMSFEALKKANDTATSSYDREHVTPFIIRSKNFKKFFLKNRIDLSNERWTVDEEKDFELVKNIYKEFAFDFNISWKNVLELKKRKPNLFSINSNIKRNEGALMGKGQKLWRRAKTVIPGGNMLLSKRSEMFLPELWPSYFKKAKGCKVWDLDNRLFYDMSLMGIGTNILGYGHPEVDDAVRKTIKNGNMSTLNCPEEVQLAEQLIHIHPWADMVKLARSGGEANAIAIRIARAASKRDKVAVCGYHGWHDWYLSANLNGDQLEGHLLPGLDPLGVPRELKNSVFTFDYNNFEQLEEIVLNHNIGVIKMEVSRNYSPKDGFLEKVRNIANEKNIILIFDECTSGFRQTNGGLHIHYKVDPDMAIFGKALGNGYAITAVLGKKEIMNYAQSTFISSTFWTERIGPTAAIKTLEVMDKLKSWDIITSKGLSMITKWDILAKKHNLKIRIEGIPSMIGFSIDSKNWLMYKTFITQVMLENGFLASNAIYFSTEHSEKIISEYLEILDEVFEKISQFEYGDLALSEMLNGPVCHNGFRRLN